MSEVSRWMPGLACSTASPADRGGSRFRLLTVGRYALQVGEIVRPAALLIYGDDATVEGLGAFSLGGELRSLPAVADHDATIPAYEFDSPLRG